jgi:hypothetical protein
MTDFGHGGRREGAGRKRKHRDPAEARALLALQAARAKRESYLAHLAELEFKQKQGDLIRASDAAGVLEKGLAALLAEFASMPAELGALLAGETDAITIEHLIEEQVRRRLTAVATEGRA